MIWLVRLPPAPPPRPRPPPRAPPAAGAPGAAGVPGQYLRRRMSAARCHGQRPGNGVGGGEGRAVIWRGDPGRGRRWLGPLPKEGRSGWRTGRRAVLADDDADGRAVLAGVQRPKSRKQRFGLVLGAEGQMDRSLPPVFVLAAADILGTFLTILALRLSGAGECFGQRRSIRGSFSFLRGAWPSTASGVVTFVPSFMVMTSGSSLRTGSSSDAGHDAQRGLDFRRKRISSVATA